MDKSLYKDIQEAVPIGSGKWYDPRMSTIKHYQQGLDSRLA